MIREAMLWRPAGEAEPERVDCFLCAHRCRIAEGKFGICGVRQNRAGRLHTLVYGDAVAANVDPIEKKPLYHFLPGTTSLSVATIGCNFRCGFCQNWQISQADGRAAAGPSGHSLPPAEIVAAAQSRRCASISYTYTEPTIFFEYAYDTAALAATAGLANVFVTNGYMTAEALRTIAPHLDAANVDLKAFRDETYRSVCKARLAPVLESIRLMRELRIWVEVTTLIVPGLNDTEAELADIAGFIAGVDEDIPWHISRFHPDYEYLDAAATPVAVLRRAAALGREAGLRYVYVGNVLGEGEDTSCPACGETVLRRQGFAVAENRLQAGRCPRCGRPLAGVWAAPQQEGRA